MKLPQLMITKTDINETAAANDNKNKLSMKLRQLMVTRKGNQ